jgi:hypothetical protein
MTVDSDMTAAKLPMAHIASRARSKSAAARSSCDLFECLCQILTEQSDVAFNTTSAANHDMISAFNPVRWQHFARKYPKAPLHPVTDNRVANFFGNRNTKPHRRVSIGTITNEQNKSAVRCTFGRIGGKEILACANFG